MKASPTLADKNGNIPEADLNTGIPRPGKFAISPAGSGEHAVNFLQIATGRLVTNIPQFRAGLINRPGWSSSSTESIGRQVGTATNESSPMQRLCTSVPRPCNEDAERVVSWRHYWEIMP